jgi:hypothetical protein
MKWKFRGFYGGGYEECHFLGHNITVRTSHETHYVSDIDASWLMLRKIEVSTAVATKNAVVLNVTPYDLQEQTFRKNVSPISLGWLFVVCFSY